MDIETNIERANRLIATFSPVQIGKKYGKALPPRGTGISAYPYIQNAKTCTALYTPALQRN